MEKNIKINLLESAMYWFLIVPIMISTIILLSLLVFFDVEFIREYSSFIGFGNFLFWCIVFMILMKVTNNFYKYNQRIIKGKLNR